MANWYNVRWIAVGPERDVRQLRAVARPFVLLARKKPSWADNNVDAREDRAPLFTADMIHGEGGNLFEEPLVHLTAGRAQTQYGFQVAGDDGIRHFTEVSRKFLALRFLLVWADAYSCGSAYVRKGRVGLYEMGNR